MKWEFPPDHSLQLKTLPTQMRIPQAAFAYTDRVSRINSASILNNTEAYMSDSLNMVVAYTTAGSTLKLPITFRCQSINYSSIQIPVS